MAEWLKRTLSGTRKRHSSSDQAGTMGLGVTAGGDGESAAGSMLGLDTEQPPLPIEIALSGNTLQLADGGRGRGENWNLDAATVGNYEAEITRLQEHVK